MASEEQNTSRPPDVDRNFKVVLADGNIRFRNLARDFLQAAGHEVIFADTGTEALEKVRSLRPEVLITEILLPKMDGLALCRAVKADSALANTRVLVLSVLAASVRARDAGADGFLVKPLAQAKLAAALATIVATSL